MIVVIGIFIGLQVIEWNSVSLMGARMPFRIIKSIEEYKKWANDTSPKRN